jgi:predicted DNA binding CopG/RHH family protein
VVEDLIRKIEGRGEEIARRGKPARLRVALRSERITIRLSADEVDAMDRRCVQLGIGRSTLLRLALRQMLGLLGDEHAPATLDVAAAAEVLKG